MKMSAIFTKPITASAFTVSKSRKFEEPTKILAKRLDFCGQTRCRTSVSWDIRRRNQRIMKGSHWARASASDEGVPAFVQESLTEESLTSGGGGLETTLNNLSKWLVGAVFSAIFIWRHDAEAIWAAMGSVINAVLALTFKKILNQERPDATVRSDPGMPSSHAQSITYTTTFLILSMVERYGINSLTTTLSGVFIALASYFTWLRVSHNLHTVSQVVVGAIIGTTFTILWIWTWNTYVLKLFISTLWVRIVVVLGAIGFLLGWYIYNSYGSLIMED